MPHRTMMNIVRRALTKGTVEPVHSDCHFDKRTGPLSISEVAKWNLTSSLAPHRTRNRADGSSKTKVARKKEEYLC